LKEKYKWRIKQTQIWFLMGVQMLVMGIDEAGRGPVIGPLVMCGYVIEGKDSIRLKKLGVKDSKKLSHKQRINFVPELKKLSSSITVHKLTAKEIDSMRTTTNLNKIEIKIMQGIINKIEPDKIIIDAIQSDVEKFHNYIMSGLNNKQVELICENFADNKYPEVSAASVIAKVERDREVDMLKHYGFRGSGYTSDPATIAFLRKWLENNKTFPDFVRKSWITSQEMIKNREQKTLRSFN